MLPNTPAGTRVIFEMSTLPAGSGGAPIYAVPQFNTGDERYLWLNRLQAIAKGTLNGSRLAYEVYEVR